VLGLIRGRHLVEFAQIVRQVVIVLEPPQIALVGDVIDDIEAHQAGEQPPVGLGLHLAAQIALATFFRCCVVALLTRQALHDLAQVLEKT
jgi:hypothetical protein